MIDRLATIIFATAACWAIFAHSAAAQTACDWEWGGRAELAPAPCPSPARVILTDAAGNEITTHAVMPAPSSSPFPVAVISPSAIPVTPNPLPVAVDDSGGFFADWRNETLLAAGLCVFLLAIAAVGAMRKARRG